jgi:hypothetical protein
MRKTIAIVLGFLLLVVGCSMKSFPRSDTSRETAVSNQLRQVYFQIHREVGDGDRFPSNFVELGASQMNGALFVCPEIENQRGAMDRIEEWSDFIYVGNNTEEIPTVPLIISPPENHDGKYGFVVFVDGVISELPAPQVRDLVKEPWLLVTNTPEANIAYMKKRVTVFVPKKFKALYPDAYCSTNK